MRLERARDRLARDATILKQAWVVSRAWIGRKPHQDYLKIPDYLSWPKRRLLIECESLREDFEVELKKIIDVPPGYDLMRVARWMQPIYERLRTAGPTGPAFKVSLAGDFEKRFGRLKVRDHIEVPPYAEMLVQGFHGLGIRHPEYQLARDVEFLLNAYRQTEALLNAENWAHPPRWETMRLRIFIPWAGRQSKRALHFLRHLLADSRGDTS